MTDLSKQLVLDELLKEYEHNCCCPCCRLIGKIQSGSLDAAPVVQEDGLRADFEKRIHRAAGEFDNPAKNAVAVVIEMKATIIALQEIIEALTENTRANSGGDGWQPIETAPKDGSIVLVHYKNSHKKSRIVKAFYAARFAIESDLDSDNHDYDEASDTYFIPEGWYELIDNWDDFSSITIHQGVPDFWQPLPTPPRA